MGREKTSQEEISDRLHDAVERLRRDVTRIEIWAAALGSFSQPVPDYAPDAKYELGRGNGDDKNQPKKGASSRGQKRSH